MAYLVIAYPELVTKDFLWIQDYRKQNDPRFFSVVEPHITLVFPVLDIDKFRFVDEVTKQIESQQSFDFTIRVATINKDLSGEYFHEFLVPDEGYSNIVKLHDKLYSGLFAGHQRFDVDYIPHIGIGNSEDALKLKRRVDELNAQNIEIKGKISSLDIVEYRDDTVTTIKKIHLR